MSLYGVVNLWFRWPVTYPDQSGDPTVFPYLPMQSFLVEKSPEWSTIVAVTASGRERRATYWSAPIWSFKVKYDGLRQDTTYSEFATLLAFFQTYQGKLSTWKYYDRSDNSVTNQPFGIADGITSTWQLIRYINNLSTASEPIWALNGTPTIYVNGTATSVTIGNYGSVSFATPPAAGATLSWTGSFFFLCRFDLDKLAFGQPYSTIFDLGELTFVSVKPDRTTA